MKPEDLINWGKLSRLLSGSRQTVRKRAIPKIHQDFVKELIEAIDKVIKKRTPKQDAPDFYHNTNENRIILKQMIADGKE